MTPRHLTAANPVVLEARVVKGSGGGPDKTILNSPRFLQPLGYRTVCAYLHPPGDPGFEQLRAKARRWQAPLVSIPDRGPLDWKIVPLTLNVCRREKVAVWHGHDYKTNLLGLILRRFWPMRLVTTVHGWVHHTTRTPLYYTIDRYCLPRYERVLCVSEDLHRVALECRVPAERCLLLENGIDTEEFSRQRTPVQARNELGLPVERFLIGAVGRLSPEKGFDVLVRAMAELVRRGLDAGIVLVGEGEQRGELEALAASLGVRDRLHLAGFQGDTRQWYEAMDAYALSSLREGLPNVVLEALAMGVPVVATRIAGVPRVIEDGGNGLLVEPGSVEELTAALSRLYHHTSLRDRIRREGRRTVEERYSFANRMKKVARIFDELLRHRRSY